eukprot:SAG22_NODE_3888_length_1482_cov_1.383225_3_plen_51_part_01
MQQHVHGMKKYVLDQKKDALSQSRSAASKETEVELRKLKHDLDAKYLKRIQ